MDLERLVEAAQRGDLAAYGRLVEATQRMVHGVVRRILRHHDDAMDAAQETYLIAFRRLGDLREPAAFPGWLRRVAVTTAQRLLRSRRSSFVEVPEIPDVPVLDESETAWTADQRDALAAAILQLDEVERLLCDRHYHGGWSLARLAADAGVNEPAMRKRMQRIRDKLRKEIEMGEQGNIAGQELPHDLPARITELLAKPQLTDLPENPVGRIWEMIRTYLPEFAEIDVPEVIEDARVREAFGDDILNRLIRWEKGVHRIDATHFLRAELDVAMVLAMRGRSGKQRTMAAGKVYRTDKVDAVHLQAFHQGELMIVDRGLREWDFMDRILQLLEGLFPAHQIRQESFEFPLCTRAWEVSMEWEGRWAGMLAWGLYRPEVLRWLGNDPAEYSGIGVGFGLERLACLRFDIDDIRKVESARVGQQA
jgi:RNA polymerase sigma-70 factor (ECF subfamily)